MQEKNTSLSFFKILVVLNTLLTTLVLIVLFVVLGCEVKKSEEVKNVTSKKEEGKSIKVYERYIYKTNYIQVLSNSNEINFISQIVVDKVTEKIIEKEIRKNNIFSVFVGFDSYGGMYGYRVFSFGGIDFYGGVGGSFLRDLREFKIYVVGFATF